MQNNEKVTYIHGLPYGPKGNRLYPVEKMSKTYPCRTPGIGALGPGRPSPQ